MTKLASLLATVWAACIPAPLMASAAVLETASKAIVSESTIMKCDALPNLGSTEASNVVPEAVTQIFTYLALHLSIPLPSGSS
jgi:hypothetical protein